MNPILALSYLTKPNPNTTMLTSTSHGSPLQSFHTLPFHALTERTVALLTSTELTSPEQDLPHPTNTFKVPAI